jgi:hypothetical protein
VFLPPRHPNQVFSIPSTSHTFTRNSPLLIVLKIHLLPLLATFKKQVFLSRHVSKIPRASSQYSQEPRALQTRLKLHGLSRRLQHAEHFDWSSRVGNSSAMWSWAGIIMHNHLASNQQQLPCLPGNLFSPATPFVSRA